MRSAAAALLLVASAASAQVTLTPNFARPRGGDVIQLRGVQNGCADVCRVAFDGVPSPKVTSVPDGLDAVAPPHAEGIVSITISNGAQVLQTIDGAFAYIVDREPVLVPIYADGVAGANGALWATEVWVHNDGDRDVTLQPAVCSFIGLLFNCGGDPMLVKANSSRKLPAINFSSPVAIGLYVYPPREASAQIFIDARLLDRARLGAGTALPVVRESAMKRAKLTMLNVPGDSVRARRRLRIYVNQNAAFAVRVYDLDSGRQLAEHELDANLPTDAPGQPLFGYTINDDVFDAGAGRLRVEVEQLRPAPGLLPFWAFISVTDNVTQEVTIIAPQ
jgi:hypothetical protein